MYRTKALVIPAKTNSFADKLQKKLEEISTKEKSLEWKKEKYTRSIFLKIERAILKALTSKKKQTFWVRKNLIDLKLCQTMYGKLPELLSKGKVLEIERQFPFDWKTSDLLFSTLIIEIKEN